MLKRFFSFLSNVKQTESFVLDNKFWKIALEIGLGKFLMGLSIILRFSFPILRNYTFHNDPKQYCLKKLESIQLA
ncbi:unnamed protein product [Rhizophagus irregularis]|nr:unnamed protein product [Rhizophagus irregularis]